MNGRDVQMIAVALALVAVTAMFLFLVLGLGHSYRVTNEALYLDPVVMEGMSTEERMERQLEIMEKMGYVAGGPKSTEEMTRLREELREAAVERERAMEALDAVERDLGVEIPRTPEDARVYREDRAEPVRSDHTQPTGTRPIDQDTTPANALMVAAAGGLCVLLFGIMGALGILAFTGSNDEDEAEPKEPPAMA